MNRATALSIIFPLLLAAVAFASERPAVKFARLKWSAEEKAYNPRPTALARLSYELVKRTSIEMDVQTADVEPKGRELYEYPMIFMTIGAPLENLSADQMNNIKTYILNGGFLVVDSINRDYDASIRKFIASMFPKEGLQKVSADHVLYKTFYLLYAPYGRLATPAFVEAVTIDNRIALLYSQLDMQGAWARDAFGNWEHSLERESANERELAFRFGVNLVMYATCFDYKNDSVHLPFILRRRR